MSAKGSLVAEHMSEARKLLVGSHASGRESDASTEFMEVLSSDDSSSSEEDATGFSTMSSGCTSSEAAAYVPTREQMSPMASDDSHDNLPKMRRKMKLYKVGESVELYNTKHRRWMLDAEVVEVLAETTHCGGLKVRAGSMKVAYAGGARFQWVAPQQLELLRSRRRRPSQRVRVPERKDGDLQLMGEGGFFCRWQSQYVDVKLGQLFWFDSKEIAQSSGKGELNGSLNLFGLDLQVEGSLLKLKVASMKDVVHTFSAASAAEAQSWSSALTAQAAYATSMKELFKQEQGVMNTSTVRASMSMSQTSSVRASISQVRV